MEGKQNAKDHILLLDEFDGRNILFCIDIMQSEHFIITIFFLLYSLNWLMVVVFFFYSNADK